MKKFITILLSAALLITPCAVALDTDEALSETAQPLCMYGDIVEQSETTIEIKNELGEDSVRLNLLEDTYFVDAISGKPVSLEERESDRVAVYYGPATTKSIPPQSNAIAVVLNLPEKVYSPHYSVVESIERSEGQIRILTDGGSLYVTITDDKPLSFLNSGDREPGLEDIVEGSELMLWYDIIAMSYPGQTGAHKTVILNKEQKGDEIILVPLAGVASINTVETDLEGMYTAGDDTLMLPLRLICETLDYDVNWIEGTPFVEISRDETALRMEFNNPLCTLNSQEITLEVAPVVDNGRTFVSVSFFEQVLGVNMIIKDFEG